MQHLNNWVKNLWLRSKDIEEFSWTFQCSDRSLYAPIMSVESLKLIAQQWSWNFLLLWKSKKSFIVKIYMRLIVKKNSIEIKSYWLPPLSLLLLFLCFLAFILVPLWKDKIFLGGKKAQSEWVADNGSWK